MLELLVVVAIIGILVGYVAPRYFSQLGKSEVTAARAQIDAFEKALRILPDYAAAYRELGKSLRDAGRTREAEESWGQGVVVAQQRRDTQTLKELLVLLKRLKQGTG